MIKNKISINQSVVQIKGNIVSDMDGEKVMFSVSKGKYYNLGGIGGDIWNFMNEEIPIVQIIDGLMTIYLVEKDECEEHVISFLELLLEEGLIEITADSSID